MVEQYLKIVVEKPDLSKARVMSRVTCTGIPHLVGYADVNQEIEAVSKLRLDLIKQIILAEVEWER